VSVVQAWVLSLVRFFGNKEMNIKMLNIPKEQLKPGVYVQDGKKFIVK
jgi:hypothetical protein